MITLPEFGIFISVIGGVITIYENFFLKKINLLLGVVDIIKKLTIEKLYTL